jgi:hypothetical protein
VLVAIAEKGKLYAAAPQRQEGVRH